MKSAVLASSVVVLALVACGGAIAPDVTADRGASSSSGASGGGGSGVGGDDGPSPPSSSSSSSGGVSADASVGSSSGSSGTGAADAGTTVVPITCGNATCGAGQECCGTQQGLACVQADTCQGLVLPCTSAATCAAGQVCCATFQGGGLPMVACTATCGGGGGGGGGGFNGQQQLCATDAECLHGHCVPVQDGIKVCGR